MQGAYHRWLLTLVGLCVGIILAVTLLCLLGSGLSLLYPLAVATAGIAVILGIGIWASLRQHSILAGLALSAAALFGLAASSIPPIRPVVLAASSWITFFGYRGELDREVSAQKRKNKDAAVIKVTVYNMMLMSRGYAIDVSGQNGFRPAKPTGLDWPAELGIPCVEVSHLYGRYYSWYSVDCDN